MAGETYSFKGSTCQWGTLSTSTAGTVVDETMDKTAQTDPVENSMGARTGLVIYDTLYTGQLTIVAAASATLPDIGATVTIKFNGGDVSLVCNKVTDKGTHKGKRMFTVDAEGGVNLVLSSGTSGTSGTGGTQQGG